MKKKTAWYGVLIALAFLLSYIETLIPLPFGIPGMKIGLANIVVMIALYAIGAKDAFLISIARIVLNGFTFGNLFSILYSCAGALLSYIVMVVAKKTQKFSIIGVSVLGGVFHNIGQIIVAMLVVETAGLAYYIPILAVSGTVAGIFTGFLGAGIMRRLEKGINLP